MKRFCLLALATFYFVMIFEIGYDVGGKIITISQEVQKLPLTELKTALERIEK